MKLVIYLLIFSICACTQIKQRREDVSEARRENIDQRQEQRRKGNDIKQDSPDYAPIYPITEEKEIQTTDGSLFNPHFTNIFSTNKSYNIGDIINIKLKEETIANKNAKSSLDKSNEFQLEPVSAGGDTIKIQNKTISGELSQTSSFEGEGTSSQSNKFEGSIAVTVIKVFSNGNLLIRGEKWLMLNNGNEFIRITGIIRKEDIHSDNSIESYKIADARIQYGALDDLGEAQIQGWISKFLNGPNWPL